MTLTKDAETIIQPAQRRFALKAPPRLKMMLILTATYMMVTRTTAVAI